MIHIFEKIKRDHYDLTIFEALIKYGANNCQQLRKCLWQEKVNNNNNKKKYYPHKSKLSPFDTQLSH